MPITDKDVADLIGSLQWKLILAESQIKDLMVENEKLKGEAEKKPDEANGRPDSGGSD